MLPINNKIGLIVCFQKLDPSHMASLVRYRNRKYSIKLRKNKDNISKRYLSKLSEKKQA